MLSKTSLFKTFALSGLLVLASCSTEDDAATEANQQAALTSEQAQLNAQAETTTDQAFNLIELAYSGQEESTARSSSVFSNCAVITVDLDGQLTLISIDFGQGCQLNNGHFVSGLLHLSYGPVVNGTRTINYQFEDFTVNQKGVAGGGTILRVHSNANGNPQSTLNKNLVVSFPSGVTADVTGTRVAEWIEGFASGTWQDNVFLISGNRDIDFSNGYIHQVEVLDALRREATCDYFVSGTMEVTRNLGTGAIDFGQGQCDNLATLTVGGQEYTIVLN